MIPLIAVVGSRGDLVLPKHKGDESNRLTAREALRFARWIYVTFGEPKP